MSQINIYKEEDYTSFYNVNIKTINRLHKIYKGYSQYSKIKVLSYCYKDIYTNFLIEEEMFITSNNRMFFNIFDAIRYEYGLNLTAIDF